MQTVSKQANVNMLKKKKKKATFLNAVWIIIRHKLVTWKHNHTCTLAHTQTRTELSYTFVAHCCLAETPPSPLQKNKRTKKKVSAGLCWLSCTILWHLISAMYLYKITVVYNILYFKCCIYWLRGKKNILSVCIKINKGPWIDQRNWQGKKTKESHSRYCFSMGDWHFYELYDTISILVTAFYLTYVDRRRNQVIPRVRIDWLNRNSGSSGDWNSLTTFQTSALSYQDQVRLGLGWVRCEESIHSGWQRAMEI